MAMFSAARPWTRKHPVSRFGALSKSPMRATAARYMDSGDYYWNSGMFLFQARAFLAELERLEPELLAHCRAAVRDGKADLDFFRLDAKAFEACKSISIDYAVMEHAAMAALVPVEMGWSDIGSWEALWSAGDRDGHGNAIQGDVLHHGARNSYLRSEGPMVAAVGVEDLVVVATTDAVLVSRKEMSQDVKRIVEQLEKAGRELHVTHRKVYRPWGSYEGLDQGEKFQVKHITVNPGAKLSLQMHHKRAEHWVVVSGIAQVTCGDKVFALHENEFDLHSLGRQAQAGEYRTGAVAPDRGPIRQLSGRGRYRPLRRQLWPLGDNWRANYCFAKTTIEAIETANWLNMDEMSKIN